MIRVLIGASSVIMQVGLEAMVASSPNLQVAGSLTDFERLPQQIETVQPEVVLLEVDAPDETLSPLSSVEMSNVENGLSFPAIVLLVDDVPASWLAEALRAGVRGILPIDAIAADIIMTIEAVAAGLVTLHPDLVEVLLPSLPVMSRSLPASPSQVLTPREIEVLGMLAEGLGNKAIAKRLSISEHTVKFHISSIFTKFGVSSRTEAVMLGARQGLILL
ncbi:response regulator transcription factor [Oculatella sp. LEGE 06141]|uniref:LuxR C-terminal-related transcriptional regulator n=1 Tax=Oculatella sp. LEGE 06141 TaxID=1828648 RepID=UPI0018807B74|nr:response regulator transcription factor [Oculatella sp. LEGE 06141]